MLALHMAAENMTPADFRAARKTLGLTQPAWGLWLGISLSHVKAIEGGAANVTKTVEILVRLYLAGGGRSERAGLDTG